MTADSALSIWGTRIVDCAWIHTSPVLTSLSESTLIIARATHFNGLSYRKDAKNKSIKSDLFCNLESWLTYFVTADHTISSVAFKACATHGSSWSGRVDFAICIGNTRGNHRAWVYTAVFATSLVANLKSWAIHIRLTLNLFYNWLRN